MQNLIKFSEQLKVWREERHLTIESQRQGYIRNVMEELGELAEAIKNNDNHAKIDALCDIMVFSLNCVEEIFKETYLKSFIIHKKDDLRTLLSKVIFFSSEFSVYDLNCLYLQLRMLAYGYGYDFDIAMEECIKELNSRTGHWDDELKKFVKDSGFYDKDEIIKHFEFNCYKIKAEWINEGKEFFNVKYEDTDGEIRISKYKKWYGADYEKARIKQ